MRSGLPTGNDPDGMDEARNVPQKREQQVEPELCANAFLQEDAKRGKEDGEKDADEVAGVGGHVSQWA